MVSHAKSGRARRAALIGAGVLALFSSALGNACSREQNLVDEPDSGSNVPGPRACDGGIPEVDSGVASVELTPCAERPLGDCEGANDFPCEFDPWFQSVVESCQAQSDCHAAGCVEAHVGENGCVESLHMTEPQSALIECLVETLGAYRCPCGITLARRYLGVSTGCGRPCTTGEQICPGGETCVDGICQPIGAGGGG